MAQSPYNPTESVAPDVRAPDDTLHVNATPASFGGEVAGGLSSVGQGLRESGLFLDKAIATQATNKIQQQWQNILYGTGNPDDPDMLRYGYKGLSASEQVNQRQAIEQSLEGLINQTKAGMFNLNQQTQFETESRRFQAYALSDLGRIFSSAHDSVVNKAMDDSISTAHSMVQANPSSDDTAAGAETQIQLALMHKLALTADPHNITTDHLEAIDRDAKQRVAQQRIQSLAGQGDVERARSLFDQNKSLLAGTPGFQALENYVTIKEFEGKATGLANTAIRAAQEAPVPATNSTALAAQAQGGPYDSIQAGKPGVSVATGSRVIDPKVTFPGGVQGPVTDELAAKAGISPEKQSMLNLIAKGESYPDERAWTAVNQQDHGAFGAFQFRNATAQIVAKAIPGLSQDPRDWTQVQQIQAANWLLNNDYAKNSGGHTPQEDWANGKFNVDAIAPTWIALQPQTQATYNPGITQEDITARQDARRAAALQHIQESGQPIPVQQAAMARVNVQFSIDANRDNAALARQTDHLNKAVGSLATGTINTIKSGDQGQITQWVESLPQRLNAIPGLSPSLYQQLLTQPAQLLEQQNKGNITDPGRDFGVILPQMTDGSISNADQLYSVLGKADLKPYGRAEAESIWHNANNPDTKAETFNHTQLLGVAQDLLGRPMPGEEDVQARYLADVNQKIQEQHQAGVPYMDMLKKDSFMMQYIKKGANEVQRSWAEEAETQQVPGGAPVKQPELVVPPGVSPTVANAVKNWSGTVNIGGKSVQVTPAQAMQDITGLMQHPSPQYKAAFNKLWGGLGWDADRILAENKAYTDAVAAVKEPGVGVPTGETVPGFGG